MDGGATFLASSAIGDGLSSHTHAQVSKINKTIPRKNMASMWVDVKFGLLRGFLLEELSHAGAVPDLVILTRK